MMMEADSLMAQSVIPSDGPGDGLSGEDDRCDVMQLLVLLRAPVWKRSFGEKSLLSDFR
jgi:hypothetical protein